MNIVGITKKQVFKDEKTGYTGFFLSVKGEDKIIFCKGIMQQLSCNLPVQLEGNFKVQDDRHYFSFTSYTILNENISILNSTELLSEKDCFTIGNQLPDLTQIKSAYDIKSVIDDNKLASQIYNKVHRMLLNYNLCKLIITAGGKYCNYTKALNKIGENAYDKLIKNPYKYGAMCEMKFSVCDNIAKKYKISKLDRRRVYGLLNYILYDALDNGDTYILSDDLDSYIKKFDISEEIPAEYIYAIAYLNDSYICENGKIYLRNIYAEEKNVAKAVLKLQRLASQSVLDEPLLNKIITANNIELSVSQRKACECLTNEGISIITGGPGTGKTTLTNILIQYLKEKYTDCSKNIFLCAPTGCAAQNLATKTEHRAETVHKMLGLQPFSENECRITEELPIGIYIIDEFSMMDLEMSEKLLGSIPPHSHVLIIGDANQLPSVNAGNVLQDLIESNIIPHYELTEIHRQSENSSIIKNAYTIISNNPLKELASDETFNIMTVDSAQSAYDLAMSYLSSKDDDYTILSPIKKSPGGVYALNEGIQEKFNANEKVRTRYGNMCFRLRDKIIMTKNNYTVGYFNGETGEIIDADEHGIEVSLSNNRRLYIDNANLSDVSLGYSLTIHKSQGREYDNVIIILPAEAQFMLNKNIIYTAVTRAKKTVTIIETKGMLNLAINKEPKRRLSTLKEYLTAPEGM